MTVAGGTFRCCRGCAMRYGWTVQEFIRRGLQDVPDGTWVGLLTLTEGGEFRSAEDHAEAVSRLMEALPMFLARQVCPDCKPPRKAPADWKPARHAHTPLHLPYAGVREFQERGAMHTHVILRGWPRVNLAELRELALLLGFGARGTNVRAKMTGPTGKFAADQVAAYLAKSVSRYLGKSLAGVDAYGHMLRHLPEGSRLLVHSRDWLPGESLVSVAAARRDARREDVVANPPADPGPMPSTGVVEDVVTWARDKRSFYDGQVIVKAAERQAAYDALRAAEAVLADVLGPLSSVVDGAVREAWAGRASGRGVPGDGASAPSLGCGASAAAFSSSTDTDFSAVGVRADLAVSPGHSCSVPTYAACACDWQRIGATERWQRVPCDRHPDGWEDHDCWTQVVLWLGGHDDEQGRPG